MSEKLMTMKHAENGRLLKCFRLFNLCVSAYQLMGYNLSPGFVNTVLYKFDTTGRRCLMLDTFIQSMVMITGLTDAFRARDVNLSGTINMAYEDFLDLAITYKS
jgi:hypothetical protein